jgi:glycosyltransferase involved in cell wall biosynthesis
VNPDPAGRGTTPREPQLSYLSAVRNEEKWIESCIASFVVQEPGAELVIVDDNSTDRTPEILDRLCAGLPNVRWYRNPRVGKVSAFNEAFSHSTGDYVIMLAGDDQLPADAVRIWREAVQGCAPDARVVVRGKLRTMSAIPRQDGLVIPRGDRGNPSGGTTLISRTLAELVFPIPEQLPSEDIWLSAYAAHAADVKQVVPEVVLLYRIHEGNSNPRNRNFDDMTRMIAGRMVAYELLQEDERGGLPPEAHETFTKVLQLEHYRQKGQWWKLLAADGTPLRSRLRAVSMSTPWLWQLRRAAFRVSSGW